MSRRSWSTVAVLFLSIGMALSANAPQSEKSTGSTSQPGEKAAQERHQAATDAARQMLLLMDAAKSGKITKEEWMKFMEAEFDRLDSAHTGKLDVKELTQSRIRLRPAVGK